MASSTGSGDGAVNTRNIQEQGGNQQGVVRELRNQQTNYSIPDVPLSLSPAGVEESSRLIRAPSYQQEVAKKKTSISAPTPQFSSRLSNPKNDNNSSSSSCSSNNKIIEDFIASIMKEQGKKK